jgi:hypothetical protein
MIHGLTDRVAKSAIQSIPEADDIFDRETGPSFHDKARRVCMMIAP